MEEEIFDVYEDEDGNEFVVIDGKRVALDKTKFDVVEEIEDVQSFACVEKDSLEEQFYEVLVDEAGVEYVLIDGQRVNLEDDDFEIVELDVDACSDDSLFNPFAYENVQAATDVANDFAHASGDIVREGAALAGEMKEAMDDIKSMLDFKSWLK